MSINRTGPRQYTHDASTPAILLIVKDGMIQKGVVFGSPITTVYVREEGRGGFGHVPVEVATDFLAFDDLLTLEPDELAAADSSFELDKGSKSETNAAPLLSITVTAAPPKS